jgi:hypothetical protein
MPSFRAKRGNHLQFHPHSQLPRSTAALLHHCTLHFFSFLFPTPPAHTIPSSRGTYTTTIRLIFMPVDWPNGIRLLYVPNPNPRKQKLPFLHPASGNLVLHATQGHAVSLRALWHRHSCLCSLVPACSQAFSIRKVFCCSTPVLSDLQKENGATKAAPSHSLPA